MELLRHFLSCCPPFGLLRSKNSELDELDDFVPLKAHRRQDDAASIRSANTQDTSAAAQGRQNYGTANPAAVVNDEEASLSRQSSVKSSVSAVAQTAARSASPRCEASVPDGRASVASTASSSTAASGTQSANSFADQGLGQLHFVLQYIAAKSTLYIRIIKGVGLTAQDSNGLSDPYVKIHLLPDTGKRTKLRTKTCQRTLNPIWDEEFCYSGVSVEDLKSKIVRLSVLDEDTIGFDWMGEIAFPLKLIAHGKKEYSEIFLQPRNLELEKSAAGQDADRGKIQLGLYYAPAKNELTVKVMQCVNLIAMDPNGYSDPFVKLYLKSDKDKSRKFKTEVKRKTLNPEFNEEFVYTVSPQELPHKTLEITVWDKDLGTKNDFIGALMLGNKCTGARWQHWEVLLQQPYQRHDRWHPLMEELLPAE